MSIVNYITNFEDTKNYRLNRKVKESIENLI